MKVKPTLPLQSAGGLHPFQGVAVAALAVTDTEPCPHQINHQAPAPALSAAACDRPSLALTCSCEQPKLNLSYFN